MKTEQRIFKAITPEHREDALDFVQQVFTEYKDAQEGAEVRALVEEIRRKAYYLPELELIAVDEHDGLIGYAMFSRFHLGGRFENELLLLSPVCVKTALQRQHISKELLEYGFEKARKLGYKAVIVEGNPANYRARGFVTAANVGILPGKTVHLPHIDCLMAMELEKGAFARIRGVVEYDMYECLTSPEEPKQKG